MKSPAAIDPEDFQRLLARNVKLPLIGGLLGACGTRSASNRC
jgi:hypothetical protein